MQQRPLHLLVGVSHDQAEVGLANDGGAKQFVARLGPAWGSWHGRRGSRDGAPALVMKKYSEYDAMGLSPQVIARTCKAAFVFGTISPSITSSSRPRNADVCSI